MTRPPMCQLSGHSSLALNGKSIGDGKCGMIVTLCRPEDGRPVAMFSATGKKEDCEVSPVP